MKTGLTPKMIFGLKFYVSREICRAEELFTFFDPSKSAQSYHLLSQIVDDVDVIDPSVNAYCQLVKIKLSKD